MAIADVSATDENAVGAALECPENIVRADGGRTHRPDVDDIGRLLHAADSGEIRCAVGAPATEKRHDPGFELITFHLRSPLPGRRLIGRLSM